jgi:hypothetical protein
MLHLAHRHDDIPEDILQQIAGAVGLGLDRATRLLFWSACICSLSLLIVIVLSLVRCATGALTAGHAARKLIPFIAIVGGLVGSWVSVRSARHRKIGQAMLEHHRCPHCGYDLRGLAVDASDGATVCPECGCAWRLEQTDGVDGTAAG